MVIGLNIAKLLWEQRSNHCPSFSSTLSTLSGNDELADVVPAVEPYMAFSRYPVLPFHSCLHSCHDVVLRRSNLGSWGFSIVGGYEENHTNQPFFIKTIVLGTPAYFDGRLK